MTDPVLAVRVGRLVIQLALDGAREWAHFGVDDGIRSPYASRLHRCTEWTPLPKAEGWRFLLGPVHLVVLWRLSEAIPEAC
jgi:hypothetical protein